ncbi:DUF6968 family protein [Nocardia cyriacigeorgica]|uniref:DUF6968 family protein n=3 Tax=Nocardia cyriacigeorgica TaxID=135487 RepID=UPI001E39AC39|nr:hypothetical protein [Nocardia cyriacigeorgica]
MGNTANSCHRARAGRGGMIAADTSAVDLLATKQFTVDGAAVRVMIGRPEPYATGRGWRCRIRVERGTSRLEQSQVVAPDEMSVVRLALELVTSRLGMSETQFFEGATVGPGAVEATAR